MVSGYLFLIGIGVLFSASGILGTALCYFAIAKGKQPVPFDTFLFHLMATGGPALIAIGLIGFAKS